MILYFSGTGNSKYVAKAIASKLGDEAYSMNSDIREARKKEYESKTPWVIVFPIYLSTIPRIVLDYLQRVKLSGAKEMYFVGTCASEVGATANATMALCKEKQMIHKGVAKVVMPQNYIALFKMTEPEEIKRRQENALATVDQIVQTIQKGETLTIGPVSKLEYAAVRVVEKMYNGPFTKTKKFYATDACVGCSLCERACPMQKIHMIDGKPKWDGSCIHCMSCINQCPKQAIEYGKKTIGKQRYVCKEYH